MTIATLVRPPFTALGTAIAAVPLAALVLVCAAATHASAQDAVSTLAGTSWRLVSIQPRGEKPLLPSDETSYTLDFQADGRLRARVDCNGGRGRWSSPAPGRIEFGVLGLTREQCKPGSLHDRIVKDWRSIRMYAIKANHLFLSLSQGAGTYEFRPLPPKEPVTSAVASIGPIQYECSQGGSRAGTLQATFYQTAPAMVLVEREGRTRPAFSVPAPKGMKYDGKDVVFAEVGGEATVSWSGATLNCNRR
jgi:heat shock protein HslJ